jgi:hypothetical protein
VTTSRIVLSPGARPSRVLARERRITAFLEEVAAIVSAAALDAGVAALPTLRQGPPTLVGRADPVAGFEVDVEMWSGGRREVHSEFALAV